MLSNAKKSIKFASVIKWLLLILSYLFILTIISNGFDNDLGWHLRFGKEFWESKHFSFTDTYTYSFYGRPWINHEWGGDFLMWPIYDYLGYPALLMIFSCLPLLAMVLAVKKISGKFNTKDAAVVLLLLWSGQQILNVRLHMFTPLFLVILWCWLEHPTAKKIYIGWPILFWLWSIIHGSWILGFIMIGIYWGGNIINLLCHHYWPNRFYPNLWTFKHIKQSMTGAIISAIIICINPYGGGVWREVLSYFTNSYYKLHTVEWLPCYYTPIFWASIMAAFITLPIILFLFQKKRIAWPQLLMYLAFWCAAWQYKRNALLFLTVCAPLMASALNLAQTKIAESQISIADLLSQKVKLFINAFCLIAIALLITYYGVNIKFTKDIWRSMQIMDQNFMPLGAVDWLNKNIQTHPILIFNDFSWGGYLNWAMPKDLIFFDGRGTATWNTPAGISYLKYYNDLNFGKNGLKEIEQQPARFIVLSKFFNQSDIIIKVNGLTGKRASATPTGQNRRLVEDLKTSPDWRLVYEDKVSWLWEKKLK